jgi:hypothetical protein
MSLTARAEFQLSDNSLRTFKTSLHFPYLLLMPIVVFFALSQLLLWRASTFVARAVESGSEKNDNC